MTIYADPDRITAIAKLQRGYEFESTESDGSLLVFDYNGRRAYAASYCCEKITDAEPLPAQKVAETSEKAFAEKADTRNADTEKPKASGAVSSEEYEVPATKNFGRTTDLYEHVPKGVAIFLALVFMAGVAVGFWILFGHLSCEKFFDNLADACVSRGSKWRYLRPAVPALLFGMTVNFTGDIKIAITIATVYQVIIWIIRTRRWNSFRSAFIESLYLMLALIGFISVAAVMLFLFLASARGSSSGKNDENNGRICKNCKFYDGSVCHKRPFIIDRRSSDDSCSNFSKKN